MKEPERLTVAIDLLDANPRNSNRMPEDYMRKLLRHIKATGHYPPIIVRPIGERYRIIDGYHRNLTLKRLGKKTVNIESWDVDEHAEQLLLATLNTLHGQDDAALRAALVESLMQSIPPADLAQLLPESEDDLNAMRKLALGEETKAPPKDPDDEAPAPLTFILHADQYVKVRNAIEHIKTREDLHGRKNADGQALYYLAVEYLSAVGWDEQEAANQEGQPPIGSGG